MWFNQYVDEEKKLKAIEQYPYFIFHERALEVLKVWFGQ